MKRKKSRKRKRKNIQIEVFFESGDKNYNPNQTISIGLFI